MRFPFLATLALLACSAFGTAAHADTFSFAFTPTGGTTTTYKVDSATANANGSQYAMSWYDSTIQGWSVGMADQQVVLYNTNFYSQYYGSLDLFWQDTKGYAYYSGSQLYTVANGVGTILTGTYQLTGNQALGFCDRNATLVITNLTKQAATAVTPEPSSLMLLGTGLMSVAGMARRRFFAA